MFYQGTESTDTVQKVTVVYSIFGGVMLNLHLVRHSSDFKTISRQRVINSTNYEVVHDGIFFQLSSNAFLGVS